jgi:protein-tyrosine phosphatase
VFQRILILCVGNVCRSPMAAAMLDAELRRAGRPREVRSAGLAAREGATADALAQLRMAERGLDLSSHRAAPLTPAMVREADLILVMEEDQRRWLLAVEPAAAGKTYRLGHWTDTDIADPHLLPAAAYDAAIAVIDAAIADWVRRI